MNQKQMQYFVTVYETQNIQAAADQLFVTRQGVSKVIRLLETELGQVLFARSSKGVMPTDYAVGSTFFNSDTQEVLMWNGTEWRAI